MVQLHDLKCQFLIAIESFIMDVESQNAGQMSTSLQEQNGIEPFLPSNLNICTYLYISPTIELMVRSRAFGNGQTLPDLVIAMDKGLDLDSRASFSVHASQSNTTSLMSSNTIT
jgi:hypothetical protein